MYLLEHQYNCAKPSFYDHFILISFISHAVYHISIRLLKKRSRYNCKRSIFDIALEQNLFFKRFVSGCSKSFCIPRVYYFLSPFPYPFLSLLFSSYRPNVSRVHLFPPNPGRDVPHFTVLRDIDGGGIEQLLDAVLALFFVADLAVLQGLIQSLRPFRDIGADTSETEVTAVDQHDEETKQKTESIAGEDVPPVVPVVAYSGHRACHGPHRHQALQPRFQKQRPIRQTVLQVPL